MSAPDELFTLKCHFYVGNYQAAIQEGTLLKHLSDPYAVDRDVYIYRSHLACNRSAHVLEELGRRGELPIALDAIRLLAMYSQDPSNKEMVLLTLNEWMTSDLSNNAHLLLVAGIIYGSELKFSDAFSALQRPNATLEHSALCVQLYLQMDRLDQAKKQVQTMRSIEEDSTLTQLASAWVDLAQGGTKCDEAAMVFQELGDRFGTSNTLLNGGAVAFMMMKNYSEAERLLNEAEATDPDTLINRIAVGQHLNKSQAEIDQYIAQLKQVAPTHRWLEKYTQLDAGFNRMASSFG